MNIRTLLIGSLLCSLLAASLPAQVELTGQITFSEALIPLPDHPLSVFTDQGDALDLLTDEDGLYTVSWADPVFLVEIETFDICTGELLHFTLETPDQGISYARDIQLCPGIDPPPPVDHCFAAFDFHPTDQPLTLQFQSAAHSPDDAPLDHAWDFGDGTTSTDTDPVHAFPAAGVYTVQLTVTGDSCSSTTERLVTVFANPDCDCPPGGTPVCVATTPTGPILFFDNPCQAECAGFGADQVVDCEDPVCVCPEYYFPVCVITAAGDSLQFSNPCFAECAGYGEDQYFACDLAGENCVCPTGNAPVCFTTPQGSVTFPSACVAADHGFFLGESPACDSDCWCPEDLYDPVCVWLPNGEIFEFVNPCEAECAGYGPDSWVNCVDPTACPTYYDPVCVATATGVTSFQNSCFATEAGFGPDQWVPCDSTGYCPEYAFPLCVTADNGDVLTFDNPCFARAAGYGPDDWYLCDGAGCPEIEEPVCVLADDGTVLVFPNYCEALLAGWEPGQYQPCDGNPGSGCPDIYDPVCITNPDGQVSTFANECLALLAGYSPEDFYPCDGNGSGCPDVYDPVCIATPGGQILTFNNECLAIEAGYLPEHLYPCDGNGGACPDIYDPVCVATPTGTLTFPNACYAEQAGYGPDQWMECTNDTGCPEVYDPVCVIDPAGTITQFPNACFAEQAGYGADSWVDCPTDSTACPDIYDPVCVATATGVLTFPNGCYAEQAGFGPDHWMECTDNPTDCDCATDVAGPVCVETDCGPITFATPCVAICLGYTPDQFSSCEPEEPLCAAHFAVDQVDSLTFVFIESSSAGEPIVEWFWDFGDGQTSNEPSPVHTYAEAGIYPVTLHIATATCTASTAYDVVAGTTDSDGGGVESPACQALFFFNQPTDDLLTFQFLNLSAASIDPIEYEWDFGDGQTSTEAAPLHTYTEAGFYLVRLQLTSGDCQSTMVLGIQVGSNVWYNPECHALFMPIITDGTAGVFFLNLSSPDAVEYAWDFGDGYTSDERDAYHAYATADTYTVTLTITTADGCTNSYTATLDLATANATGAPAFSLLNDTAEPVPAADAVRLFPNPATGRTLLVLPPDFRGAYQYELRDLSGRLVQRRQGDVERTGPIPVDVSGLPGGLYWLRLRAGSVQATLRLVVVP